MIRKSAAFAALRALKLDPKRTFDALVTRYAPSNAARDSILKNRIYRNLSDALAGVGDYMAMEKLLELYPAPGADLIVLDTPPASEAIDFLDAPQRLLDLLNSRAITLLGRSGGQLAARTQDGRFRGAHGAERVRQTRPASICSAMCKVSSKASKECIRVLPIARKRPARCSVPAKPLS